MSSDLKGKAVRGVGWLAFGQAARQITGLVVTAVLARLVLPEAFGLVGMVVALTGFLEVFQEVGLGAAVVQRQDITEEQLSTVFFITVACGLALTAIAAALSPLVAAFYGRPELRHLTMLLGLNFFMVSLMGVHSSLLRKAMDFRTLTLIGVSISVLSGVVGVIMAYMGMGVYALVGQTLVREFLTVATTWAIVRWYPKVRPRLGSVKELMTFGANVTGLEVLYYLQKSMDMVLIGRFLGAALLGIYTMATSVLIMPVRRVTSVLTQVAFPTFSAIQGDLPRIRRGFMQMLSVVSSASMPMMAGILVVAPEAVAVLLGPRWQRAAFLMRVLAVIGVLESLAALVSPIFKSLGKVRLQLCLSTVTTTLILCSYLIGIRWEIEGIVIAYAICRVVTLPLVCGFAFRLIGLSVHDFFRSVRGALGCALAMTLVVLAYRYVAMRFLAVPALPLLITEISLGVVAYAAAIRILVPEKYAEAVAMLKLFLKGAPKPAPVK